MATSEGRKPPAYQEYASSMLANRAFRLMDASTRGVFYTMRLELWANDTQKWLGLLGQVLGFLKWIPCGLRLSTVLLAEGPSRP